MLHKLRFYGSIAVVYVLTFGAIGGLVYSPHLFGATVDATRGNTTIASRPLSPPHVISGKPVRIVIPSYDIDLAVESGHYDASTKQWSLSDTGAHHAEMTVPANNRAGTTFIYGHGTDAVFGKIGTNPPALGTTAQVHTDNGHSFTYALSQIQNLTPEDTDIFSKSKQGTPRLVVQTCTGAFSEWRTMFTFELKDAR